MKEETWSSRGWRGCILKIVIAKRGGWVGVQFSYVNYFFVGGGGRGKVLIHSHTFLKTPAPLWDDQSQRVSLS